jgi:hypothetical protein
MARQYLCRLRILGCRRVESDAGWPDRIERPPVGKPIPAGELNRIHVTTRQLGSLRRSLRLGSIERINFAV